MSNILNGKTAAVTGAASGIGRAIAKPFASEDANVVVADCREDPREGGKATHEIIEEESQVNVAFVKGDVTDCSYLEAMISVADNMDGIDVLVNNAGVLLSNPFIEMTEEEYDRIMDINIKAPFYSYELATERMTDDGGGSMINVSCGAGLSGLSGLSIYYSSKSAFHLLTYALAAELGPQGIRVNALHQELSTRCRPMRIQR